MFKIKFLIKSVFLFAVILSFQACSVKFPIEGTNPSTNSYISNNGDSKELSLKYKSSLPASYNIHRGNQTEVFILEHNSKVIDADSFIKEGLEKEFKARKLPIKLSDSSSNELILEHFNILSRRTSGFSPMVTLSTLKVNINKDGEEKKFISFIKRAKVPIFAMGEVVEPCYNEPTSLLIREVVAKINREYFNYQLTDTKVDELNNKIIRGLEEKKKSLYLDVYELAFSNNIKALSYLEKFVLSSDEYVRIAAISGLGILGSDEQVDLLIQIYNNSRLWQDRGMALKSLGDINSKKAINFLKEEKKKFDISDSLEAKWNKIILNLYLY